VCLQVDASIDIGGVSLSSTHQCELDTGAFVTAVYHSNAKAICIQMSALAALQGAGGWIF
jgi:hypothetical protein